MVKTVKPTILVGTSTQPNTFTKEIVEARCENTERPIIFPLSNPTKLAEASAKDLIEWSRRKALLQQEFQLVQFLQRCGLRDWLSE